MIFQSFSGHNSAFMTCLYTIYLKDKENELTYNILKKNHVGSPMYRTRSLDFFLKFLHLSSFYNCP